MLLLHRAMRSPGGRREGRLGGSRSPRLCPLLFSFKNKKEKEREAKVKKEKQNHLQTKTPNQSQTKPPTEIHQIHFHQRCERDFLFISWVSGSYKQTRQKALGAHRSST